MSRHFLFAVLAMALATPCAQAHTLHQSSAEAEYNPATNKLEVSLTVFVSHLEVALIVQGQREMRFEQTPAAELDGEICRYLAKKFLVTDSAGKAANIEWVGRKLDADSAKGDDPMVTLYFEIALDGPVGAQLRNTVFCEMFKDQMNFVQVLIGPHKQHVHFSPGSACAQLVSPPPSPETR